MGWAVAAPPLTALIRKVHDYLTICAPAPFQEAGRTALALPDSYYEDLRREYAARRDILLPALTRAGLDYTPPEGSYYVMVDAARLGWKDDWAFVDFLAREVGVLAVPGSSFYARGGGKTPGPRQLREEGRDPARGGAATRRGGPAKESFSRRDGEERPFSQTGLSNPPSP